MSTSSNDTTLCAQQLVKPVGVRCRGLCLPKSKLILCTRYDSEVTCSPHSHHMRSTFTSHAGEGGAIALLKIIQLNDLLYFYILSFFLFSCYEGHYTHANLLRNHRRDKTPPALHPHPVYQVHTRSNGCVRDHCKAGPSTAVTDKGHRCLL